VNVSFHAKVENPFLYFFFCCFDDFFVVFSNTLENCLWDRIHPSQSYVSPLLRSGRFPAETYHRDRQEVAAFARDRIPVGENILSTCATKSTLAGWGSTTEIISIQINHIDAEITYG
jgi:hypothetical protein